jgi:hypothetical protein
MSLLLIYAAAGVTLIAVTAAVRLSAIRRERRNLDRDIVLNRDIVLDSSVFDRPPAQQGQR